MSNYVDFYKKMSFNRYYYTQNMVNLFDRFLKSNIIQFLCCIYITWEVFMMVKFRKAGISMFMSAVLLLSINVAGVSAEKNVEQDGINIIQASQYITKENSNKRVLNYNNSDDIIKAYGGTTQKLDLNSLPEGTPVIKVNSLEELDAFLASVRSQGEKALNQTIKLTPPEEKRVTSSNITPMDFGDTRTGSTDSIMYTGATWSLKLISNYILTNIPDGSWAGTWAITNVTPSTSLSGFSLGIGWVQSTATATKVNNFKWITTASGTLSFNIIINGVGQVTTMPLSGTHNVEI